MVALRLWQSAQSVRQNDGMSPSDSKTCRFEPMRVDMPEWTSRLHTSSPAPAILLPAKVSHSGIADSVGMLKHAVNPPHRTACLPSRAADAALASHVASLLVSDQTQSALFDQSATELPSRGSALHVSGACRPCAWFWKPTKCQNGQECWHCHLCPEGELKSRKKSKLVMMRSSVHSEAGGQTHKSKPSPPCSL